MNELHKEAVVSDGEVLHWLNNSHLLIDMLYGTMVTGVSWND